MYTLGFMSTEFRTQSTDEWACVRFSGGKRGACFDFGADPSRVFDVFEAAESGECFVDEAGSVWTGEDFRAEVEGKVWTFGEFGGSFDLGSGDLATFEGAS